MKLDDLCQMTCIQYCNDKQAQKFETVVLSKQEDSTWICYNVLTKYMK